MPEGVFGQLVLRLGQNIAVQALRLLLWCLTRAHDLSCPNLRVACGQLFNGHTFPLWELMPQWQFVGEGWEMLPRTEHGRKNRLHVHEPATALRRL